MTLEEAKDFYCRYLGFAFHMGREEPSKYSLFRKLHLDKSILREWDEELLEDQFKTLESDTDNIWIYHGNILDIIRRNNCRTEVYLGRLFDDVEKMTHLDLFSTTLLLENMAGRNSEMSDGGVCTVCSCSGLAQRMNEVTEKLIDSASADHLPDDRFLKAVSSYRAAYRKWNRTGNR